MEKNIYVVERRFHDQEHWTFASQCFTNRKTVEGILDAYLDMEKLFTERPAQYRIAHFKRV